MLNEKIKSLSLSLNRVIIAYQNLLLVGFEPTASA